METLPRYEKIHMLFFGIVLALLSFGYGLYALVEGRCTLIGNGNPPVGTFVTFYGMEARLLSFLFLGAGLWLFSSSFLDIYRPRANNKALSWFGAVTLMFGLCSLVFILSQPLFK